MQIEEIQHNAFRALADPHRREILKRLSAKEMTIGEIAEGFEITRAAIKKHLVILNDGGLVSTTPSGRERINRLRPDGFGQVNQWLGFFDNYWDQKLDLLKSTIESER